MNAGTSTAFDNDEEEDPFAEPEPLYETGTVLDEFIPIYRALAVWTKTHGPLSPDQVDAMDLTLVAVLLGVDPVPSIYEIHAQWEQEYAAMGLDADAEPVAN